MSESDRLSSRERILRAIRCEPVDRVPVTPFGWGHLRLDDTFTQEFIRCTDPFLTVGVGGNVFSGSRFGEFVASRQEGRDTVTEIDTPKGKLERVYRRTDITGYTVKFPCEVADDVDAYLSVPFTASEPDGSHFHAMRERYEDAGLVIAGIPNAVCLPAEVMSPESFCLMWADEPARFRDIVDKCQERLIEYVESACRAGVDVFRIVGAEYVTEQLGPVAFEALCLSQDADLVSLIHRHGGIAYYHCHGDVQQYLRYFAEVGIDALDPLETPPYGDADLREARRIVAGSYCLVGGLDDMEVFEIRTRDKVLEMARASLEAAGTTGYCLGGSASGTFTQRAAENFMAAVEVAREFGGTLA